MEAVPSSHRAPVVCGLILPPIRRRSRRIPLSVRLILLPAPTGHLRATGEDWAFSRVRRHASMTRSMRWAMRGPQGAAAPGRRAAGMAGLGRSAWGDARSLGQFVNSARIFNGAGATVLYGNQVNLLAGLTRKFTPNFLVGVLGGYETFDYRSDALVGRLKGDGWTVGSYLGWKITQSIRFDAGVAYSGIGYDGTAGTAAGSFTGNRWLVTSGSLALTAISVSRSSHRRASMRCGNMRMPTPTRSAHCKRRATSRQAAPAVVLSWPIRSRGPLRPSLPPTSESTATITSTATAPGRRPQEQSRLSSLMAGRRALLAV